MRQSIPLLAGVEARIQLGGRMFQIADTGVAPTVTVAVEWGGQQNREEYGAAADRFRLVSRDAFFSAICLTSSVNTTVDLIVSAQDVDVSPDGQVVTVSTAVMPTVAAPTNTNKTVGIASAIFLAASTTRKYLLVQNNDGSGDIYLSFANPAVTGSGGGGVTIKAGGYWEPTAVPTCAIYAIGSIANANITVVEG